MDLVTIGAISRELGISTSYVRLLADTGVLPSVRTDGGHRRFDRDLTRDAWLAFRDDDRKPGRIEPALEPPDHVLECTLHGLEEDRVWLDLEPRLELGTKARNILSYAFTEMLNNAIDHSAGTNVEIRVWRRASMIDVEIRDDGIGVFERVARGFSLPGHIAAIPELTKGKRTTDPTRHTGQGIFFTSRAVDEFQLSANRLTWIVDNVRDDMAVGVSSVTIGTSVRLTLDVETRRDMRDVFDEFTIDDDFARTRPVIQLFNIGVSFVSRSEAKRLLAGMDEFQVVELDFANVESVGQGFVDEVFRVWANAHPGTTLVPTNMNEAVRFMVTRGLPE